MGPIAVSNVIDLNGKRSLRPATDSAVELVVARIKEIIERGNLRVGDALPSEREFCQLCGASRTTVREAMRILKAYGVVDVRPKTGAILIDRRMDAVFEVFSFRTLELSRQTFLDTQEFRRLIETGCYDALVERITVTDIEELRNINNAMRNETTASGASLLDFGFHARLLAIMGNRQVDDVYRLTKPIILRIMENGVVRGTLVETNHHQHGEIINALDRRDRLAFQYRVGEHLDAGRFLFETEETRTSA